MALYNNIPVTRFIITGYFVHTLLFWFHFILVNKCALMSMAHNYFVNIVKFCKITDIKNVKYEINVLFYVKNRWVC